MNKALFEKYVDELNLDFDNSDSLLNKIKLCSYLVCCGASIELESYTLNNKDFRTGNAGLQLTVGSPHLRALIPFFYVGKDNPVKLRGSYATGRAVIECAGREFFEITVLPDMVTGNDSISLEFETLIAAIPEKPYGIRNCCYHSIGKPCAFCILKKKRVNLGPTDLVAAYGEIAGKTGAEPQVLLTGGNSGRKDRGLLKYVPYVKELRNNFGDVKIAIEASPPRDPLLLDTLIDSGMDTFAANIEFFSGQTKEQFLPGKSEIGLEEYTRAFDYCQKAHVKTFSALIAGPEDEKETLAGVKHLSKIGVPTNLLCLRPFPGSRLENYPRVNPARFLEVTRKALIMMEQYDVLNDLYHTAGCGSCGACSMEMNLYRLWKNNRDKEFYDYLLN
jgi:hypothetical protein